MINWDKELEEIFADPLLADVKAPRRRPTSADRLVAAFQEVEDFRKAHGRLPEDTPAERTLYHRWKCVLKPENIERCRPYDELGILPAPDDTASSNAVATRHGASTEAAVTKTAEEPAVAYGRELTEEEMLESILNDPLLADVGAGDDLGIFDVPDYMRRRLEERREAEYVGKHRPCDDFDKYADGFRDIQQGLKEGRYRLVKFSETNLKVGRYFVEQGVIGYLAAMEADRRRRGERFDGRTLVVYENGSEADIKYRTITKNLRVDGYSVVAADDEASAELERSFTVVEGDVESGTIYVLRSKSTRPEIAAIKDLYKIGFTVTTVESRIANARQEPTYLCADVEVVATWKVYNVKSSTFEALIHRLFAAVQLQVTVDGHRPKEWFIVPFRIIEQAVTGIIQGVPMSYDAQLKQLVILKSKKGMKCLSVQQPWASLICMGIKDVENRSWRAEEAPGRILIHTGAKVDRYAQDEAEDIIGHELPELPRGCIVGYVEVYGFTRESDSVWAGEGKGSEWKWLLRNAKMFKEPIPYKGSLGLFNVPDIDPDNLPETV